VPVPAALERRPSPASGAWAVLLLLVLVPEAAEAADPVSESCFSVRNALAGLKREGGHTRLVVMLAFSTAALGVGVGAGLMTVLALAVVLVLVLAGVSGTYF
jgi:hypothetical protein